VPPFYVLDLVHSIRKEVESVKIKALFELSNVEILLHLQEKGEVRYSELLNKVIPSRSTLALTLRDLQTEGLIVRRVKTTRPIQTTYTLTQEGKMVAEHLALIRKLVS